MLRPPANTFDEEQYRLVQWMLDTIAEQQKIIDALSAERSCDARQANTSIGQINSMQSSVSETAIVASEAMETASGKADIFRSTATPGASPGKEGDTWEQWSTLDPGGLLLKFWRHDGAAWVEGIISESYLPLVNIGSGTYGDLQGIRLAADALDGKTMTGGLIRTAATGLRFEMDALGLRAFNASNAVTASLAPQSGGLLLSGSLTSYPGGNTSRAVLSNGSLVFDLPGSGGASNLAVSPGNIRSSDSSTRLFIAKDSGSAGTGLTLQAGVSPGNTAQIHVSGDVTGGLVELAAGTVRKSSDYTWATAGTTGGPTLKPGWTNRTSLFAGLALQSKLDEVFLNGTIEKSSSYSALDVIATLPVGCRPTRLIAVNASYAGTLEYVLVYPNGDVAVSRGGTSATWINIFGGFPTT